MFADLRDYTAFVEGAGDRAAADLIRAYRELIRERLGPHHGSEVKTEGDSFYIVFASPSAAIDFGVDAFRGASESERKLRFGIGVHTGETVALDDQFVGSAVNLAARVGAIAGEGELLVTDTVRGLVRTSCPYPLVDRGPVSLKGVSEPIRVFAVEWRSESPTAAPSAPPPQRPATRPPKLVGRTAELQQLDRAAAGLGELVGGTRLIGGPAGIGKTRLVTEWSAASGIVTLAGACGATDARAPYEPFVDLLRRLSRTEEARLRRVAPELLSLLPELAGAHPRHVDRDSLYGALLRLLRDHARAAPLAVVIDDLHWADDASLALFRFLATEAAATPYLLIGTYRDDELVRGHPLRALLADLSRRTDTALITLPGLDERRSEELLERAGATRDLSADERRHVIALAEGNPLFLEELARTGTDGGEKLPLSIAEAVLRRVSDLDEVTRRLITYAAVSGQQVRFDLLARLLSLPERDLLPAARAAVERSILVETADGLAFRHALTREAVYRDLMRREQRLLHEEVADALVALHGEDPTVAHEIERQYLDAGKPDRALPHALRAGEHALELLAPAAAIEHFERAVDAAKPGSIERAKALEGLGNAYRLGLQVAKAVTTLGDAREAMRDVGSAADRFRVQRALARALPFGPAEREAHQETWRLAPGVASDAECAAIANTLADRAFQFMDDDEAARWVATARSLAAKSGSAGVAAAVERNAREIEHPLGWHAVEERELARGLDRALERDEGVLAAYRRYLDGRCRDASAEEREALLGRARSYADRQAPGVPRAIVFTYGPAWISWLEGEWDDVTAFWSELQRRFAGDDLAEIFPDTGPVAAAVRLEREGPDAAGPELSALAERQARTATWRGRLAAACHLANVQLAGGRADEVRARLGALVAQRTPQAYDVPTYLLAARAALPAALLLADRDMVRPWSEAAPLLVNEGAVFDAVAAHAEAVAAALAGDGGLAVAAFARAAEIYRQRGWDHLAAELAWQRARAGDESEVGRARTFYEARGAAWRSRWLEEGRWR